MNILELSEQEIIRRNSLNELRAMGIEPYPAAEYVTNAFSTDIKAEFKDDETPRQVSVAGRMMSRRIMGKASFIELQDSKGRIQVYITRDDICPGEDKEMYNTVFKRLLDLGDFIGIEGFVFRTQMGEISIHAQKLTVLAKSIKPLPIVKYKDGVTYDSLKILNCVTASAMSTWLSTKALKIFSSNAAKYTVPCANTSTQRDTWKWKLRSCRPLPEEQPRVRS